MWLCCAQRHRQGKETNTGIRTGFANGTLNVPNDEDWLFVIRSCD